MFSVYVCILNVRFSLLWKNSQELSRTVKISVGEKDAVVNMHIMVLNTELSQVETGTPGDKVRC